MPTIVVNLREQQCDVRICRPSKWGNPFRMENRLVRMPVIDQYREWLRTQPQLIEAARRELKGKRLGCWCAPLACHGDVLARVADGGEP